MEESELRKRYHLDAAVEVSLDLSVSDCLARMKNQGATCAIVRDAGGGLAGIFTDRDLFLKTNSAGSPVPWSARVSEVMSSPVATLALEEVHLAPEVMASRRIRHVPITVREGSGNRVLGVATMDGLFLSSVASRRSWRTLDRPAPKGEGEVGIICHDPYLSAYLGAFFAKQTGGFRAIPRSETLVPLALSFLAESVRSFVIDADSLEARQLARLILALRKSGSLERVVLLFDAAYGASEMRSLVEKLQGVPNFTCIPKPVSEETLSRAFVLQ